MSVVRDIDLSFDLIPSTKDVSVLEDEEAVKNTLYNNLFIGEEERKYYDGNIASIEDLLFEEVDPITTRLIKNTIANATEKDDRIRRINNITIKFNDITNSYEVNLYIQLDLKTRSETKDVNISLILKRQ